MNDKTDLETTHTTGNMHVTRSETNYVNVSISEGKYNYERTKLAYIEKAFLDLIIKR